MVQQHRGREQGPLSSSAASFYHRQLMSSGDSDVNDFLPLPADMYAKQQHADVGEEEIRGASFKPSAAAVAMSARPTAVAAGGSREAVQFMHPFLPSRPSPLASSKLTGGTSSNSSTASNPQSTSMMTVQGKNYGPTDTVNHRGENSTVFAMNRASPFVADAAARAAISSPYSFSSSSSSPSFESSSFVGNPVRTAESASVSPLHSRRNSFVEAELDKGTANITNKGKMPVQQHLYEAPFSSSNAQSRLASQTSLAIDEMIQQQQVNNGYLAAVNQRSRAASLAPSIVATSQSLSIPKMLLQREHVVYENEDLRAPPPSFQEMHSMVLAKLPASQAASSSPPMASSVAGKKQASFLKKRQHSVPHDRATELLPTPQSQQQAINATNVRFSIVDERIQASVSGFIILESRRAVWRKFSKVPKTEEIDLDELRRKQQRLLTYTPSIVSGMTNSHSAPSTAMTTTTEDVDPWDLPIDASSILESGATRGTRTFEFPELRTVTLCSSCAGSCQMPCHRCGGIEAGECFWCAGSGRFRGHKCTKCAQSGTLQCVKCSNTGKSECTTCDGRGALRMALCVDVKLRPVELPAMPLMDESGSMYSNRTLWNQTLRNDSTVQLKATEAVYETTQRLYEQIAQQPSHSSRGKQMEKRVPVMASCVCKRWMEWTIGVTRYVDGGMQQHQQQQQQYMLSNSSSSSNSSSNAAWALPRANSVPNVQQHYRFRLSSMAISELVPTNMGGSSGLASSASSFKPSSSRAVASAASALASTSASSPLSPSPASTRVPTPALIPSTASGAATPNFSPRVAPTEHGMTSSSSSSSMTSSNRASSSSGLHSGGGSGSGSGNGSGSSSENSEESSSGATTPLSEPRAAIASFLPTPASASLPSPTSSTSSSSSSSSSSPSSSSKFLEHGLKQNSSSIHPTQAPPQLDLPTIRSRSSFSKLFLGTGDLDFRFTSRKSVS